MKLFILGFTFIGLLAKTQPAETFDGVYNINAVPSIENAGVNTCGSATGKLIIENNIVSGKIIDDSGQVFDINATVDQEGNVNGGFAMAQLNAASFNGKFKNAQADGHWEDIYQCKGLWQIKNSTTKI